MKMPRISALNRQWLTSPQYAHAQQQAQAMAQAYNQQTAATNGWLWAGTPSATTSTATTWVTSTQPTSVVNAMMNSLYSSQGLGVPPTQSQLVHDTLRLMGELVIEDGEPCRITLPDGGRLVVAADGSYVLEDQDAKVTYRANRTRDFNPFVNASDKLEAFIKFCGALGVKQDEMMNIPVKLFIGWLIIEAARADGETGDVDLLDGIYDHVRPRCTCGRFLARERVRKKVFFCRSACMERRLAA